MPASGVWLRPAAPFHWIGAWKDWEDLCTSVNDALIELTPNQLSTHAWIGGMSGSGKTVLIHHLIASDILRGHPIFILDARGDLALATIELLARAGVDPRLVKFFNLRAKKRPLGFNPLTGTGEPYYRALALNDAAEAESSTWGPQLGETFIYAMMLLAEAGGSITQLDGLFQDPTVRRSLIEKAQSKQVQNFWERYDSLSKDKKASLASPVQNKVCKLLATEGLRRMFGHPDPVDLSKHLETPGSITIVSLAVDELHSAAWMTGSILLSSVCREVFSRATTAESSRPQLRLYVDEFEHFSMRDFETILAEGRRFGLSAVLSHQTLAQLTPKMRSIILGNVGVKVVFRSSHADAEVLNKDLTGTRGTFDIASLPVGEAILWRRGDQPFPVEINAPLIDDVGSLSPQAEAFIARLDELTPEYYEPETCELVADESSPQTLRKDSTHSTTNGSLENWLT